MQTSTNYCNSETLEDFRTPTFSPEIAPESSSSDSGIISFSSHEVILASNTPKKPAGRKKFRETRHPVYRSVRQRDSGKWVCEVREPNKKSRIWLGTFPTAEMAARAHDVATIAHRGRSACLNFADSAWRLPIPASSDAKDIQKAAVEAAEAFRPQLVEEVEAFRPQAEAANLVPAESENALLTDEEALFEMHDFDLLCNMAEGLMMLPPPHYDNDVEMYAEVPLWSYSI
ncbi:hypothetical protein ACS0TY_010379 [Phlomoides rotata]